MNEEENTDLWEASSNDNESEETVIEGMPEPVETEIIKGSKVRFRGTKSYSGLNLNLEDKIYNVKELSNDRAVLSNGTTVVGAVNTRDLILAN